MVKKTNGKGKGGNPNPKPMPPGPGRPKGVPNKFSGQLKEMILKALDDAGGANYLLTQAHDNPTAFLTLVGKVLPMTVAGDSENPLQTSITVTYVDPDKDTPSV